MTLGTGLEMNSSATIKHDDMLHGGGSLIKQDSLRGRNNYQRTGLKSLQNSENKLY